MEELIARDRMHLALPSVPERTLGLFEVNAGLERSCQIVEPCLDATQIRALTGTAPALGGYSV